MPGADGTCRIRVLGAGLVGRLVVSELYQAGHQVTLVDLDPAALEWAARLGAETILGDVTAGGGGNITPIDGDNRAAAVEGEGGRPEGGTRYEKGRNGAGLGEGHRDILDVTQADIWVNLLPGRLGDLVRRPLLRRGAKVVDLAFTPEDPRHMDGLAKANGGSLLYDVGVAPGLSNLWVANACAMLAAADEKPLKVEIRVAGIPAQPDEGWSYMAPFSPSDVIAEYEREARIRIDGDLCAEPALSRRHSFTDPEVGELEAFLTDGLRSLLDIDCPTLLEYTLRWPGHIDRFITLRDDGALAGENRVATLQELYRQWEFDPLRPEITLLSVTVESENLVWQGRLFDSGGGGWSSMARTTGLVTIAAVEAMLAGHIPPGVYSPEQVWQELLPLAEYSLAGAGVDLRRDSTIHTR